MEKPESGPKSSQVLPALFVAEGVHWIEVGGFHGGPDTEEDADGSDHTEDLIDEQADDLEVILHELAACEPAGGGDLGSGGF